MEKHIKQYNWFMRITAGLLGMSFIVISIYIIINIFTSSSGFALYQLTAIPLLAFGTLLTHTAWLGYDPLLLYNSIDAPEQVVDPDDKESSNN